MKIEFFMNRRFFVGVLNGVWRRRGGGQGFIDAERMGSILWTCLDKTQKTLRL